MRLLCCFRLWSFWRFFFFSCTFFGLFGLLFLHTIHITHNCTLSFLRLSDFMMVHPHSPILTVYRSLHSLAHVHNYQSASATLRFIVKYFFVRNFPFLCLAAWGIAHSPSGSWHKINYICIFTFHSNKSRKRSDIHLSSLIWNEIIAQMRSKGSI